MNLIMINFINQLSVTSFANEEWTDFEKMKSMSRKDIDQLLVDALIQKHHDSFGAIWSRRN